MTALTNGEVLDLTSDFSIIAEIIEGYCEDSFYTAQTNAIGTINDLNDVLDELNWQRDDLQIVYTTDPLIDNP